MNQYDSFLPYINVEEGMGRVGNNTALFLRLLNMCKDSDEYQKFEDAAKAKDIKAAELAIHSIKGVAGNLSLTKLFDITTAFCDSLRKGIWEDTMEAEYRTILGGTMKQLESLITQLK